MSTISISLSTDQDGFVSQECPACRRHFKVIFGQGSKKPILFCPYCGHQGTGCWWTEEQVDYFKEIATREVVYPELERMARELNAGCSSGDLVRIEMRVSHPALPVAPIESSTEMRFIEFSCCGERIKHDGSTPQLRCIICGTPVT